MKITINSLVGESSWEAEGEDSSLSELIPQIKGLLVLAGYHPHSVDKCFCNDEYEWFPEKVDHSQESEITSNWKYPIYVFVNGERVNEEEVEVLNIEEDIQGRDVLTFTYKGNKHSSHRVG